MSNENRNPFSITKASDFTNEQIAKYWVNFLGEKNKKLNYLLDPLDAMPKYILGGKGCGKTHLLRYFDYPIQKIRNDNKIKDIILKDKYIGIYFLLGNLNSARFSRDTLTPDRRQSLFEYYMEIFLSLQLLSILKEIISDLDKKNIENKFCSDICKIFIVNEKKEISDLDDLAEYLSSLQKEIDYEIINADISLAKSDNSHRAEIRISRGDFILGIPKLFIKHFPEFHEIKFLYILDELEKLSESQKEYINTLVWENKIPCSFWIGARNYGFKNTNTYHGESIRESSEYERVSLDEIFRIQGKKYKIFCKQLFKLRINDIIEDSIKKKINPDIFFEKFNEVEVLNKICQKFKDKIKPSTRSLRSNLKYVLETRDSKLSVKDEKDIDSIINNLSVSNPLHEKYNYFLLYQDWSKRKNLIESSESIKKDYEIFINKKQGTRQYKVENKYKYDLLAQLLEETKFNNYYSGLETFIEISWGNSRVFLTILKNIFKKATFNDENPFKGGLISLDSQESGIYDSSVWFYNDAELTGKDGMNVYAGISNIAEILRGIRFSNKPSQTSPSSFSIKSAILSEEAKKIIDLTKDHSFIIKIEKGRKDQNSKKIQLLYQINRILAPKWNLPISRRGIVPLNNELVEVIFNPTKKNTYDLAYNDYINKLNAPFTKKKIHTSFQKSLY